MTRQQRLPAGVRLISVFFAVCTFTACSGQAPTVPSGLSSVAGSARAGGDQRSQGAAGVYTLSFWARVGGAYEEVSSLPVRSAELILKATVTDNAGIPAETGTVTFEYCSYGKRPPNDIDRPDEAPKEACDQGLAKWARLESRSVENGGNCLALGSGSACSVFGLVRIPRTVGFRFRFAQQKGRIAGGTSEARNFSWVAGS